MTRVAEKSVTHESIVAREAKDLREVLGRSVSEKKDKISICTKQVMKALMECEKASKKCKSKTQIKGKEDLTHASSSVIADAE